nr:MAG TPA: hypothetical protein [Caudoviricetes sp.]
MVIILKDTKIENRYRKAEIVLHTLNHIRQRSMYYILIMIILDSSQYQRSI